LKLVNDWVKRAAFLVVGLAIAQGKAVYDQEPIDHGSVTWLLVFGALSTALVAAAIVIDLMAARGKT
jgi:hypothetical protein